MALSDVNFQDGEGMSFLLELQAGSLNSPNDILVSGGNSRYLTLETELVAGTSGGNIFIMSE